MKLRPIVAALAAVSVVAAASASAAMPTHAYVSHSPKGANKGCASPGFNTVQAAVDAVAPNGTVYLCGSEPFLEQVFLTKSVTVTGSPDASIGSPAIGGFADASHFPSQFAAKNLVVPQAIVVVTGADTKATIKGIDINGPLPGNGACLNREYGVLVLEGVLNLTQASVTNARDANENLNGCQFGVGVQVGSTHWLKLDGGLTDANFTADAEIDNTIVSGYAKNGIVIDGIGSDGDIHDNTVIGFGPTPVVAQNGIEIVRGATGEIYNNKVSGNQYTGPAEASSTGVLLFGGCGDQIVTSVDVHNNTAVNNDVGISMENYNPACAGASTAPTKNRAYNNNVTNNAVTNAYQAGIADVGNLDQIGNNKISGKGYALLPTDFTSAINPKTSRNRYRP
jgi:hypothetical protein